MKFEDYVDMAYHLANRFTCDKNVMIDRDDMVQLALIGLFKTITEKNYKEETGNKFQTYAYMVMRNEILKEFRKFNKEYLVVGGVEPDTVRHGDDPEEVAISRISWKQAKERLTEQELQVVMMMADGFLQKEISQEIGLSQSQVSRIFMRGKQKIKEVIDNGSSSGLRREACS